MNLYLISQRVNNDWDTYDSAVVAAETPEAAKAIHPGLNEENWWEGDEWLRGYSWAKHPDEVKAELIGREYNMPGVVRTKAAVVCSSFNAG